MLKTIGEISTEVLSQVLSLLENYFYPGNVRELLLNVLSLLHWKAKLRLAGVSEPSTKSRTTLRAVVLNELRVEISRGVNFL